jgi:AraC-like DNA-binding protein
MMNSQVHQATLAHAPSTSYAGLDEEVLCNVRNQRVPELIGEGYVRLVHSPPFHFTLYQVSLRRPLMTWVVPPSEQMESRVAFLLHEGGKVEIGPTDAEVAFCQQFSAGGLQAIAMDIPLRYVQGHERERMLTQLQAFQQAEPTRNLMDDIWQQTCETLSEALLLESRLIMLASRWIKTLSESKPDTAPQGTAHLPTEWTPYEQACLEKAQAILTEQFAQPPSLKELVRAVGLNEFKLKKGFRELFGHSVYQYALGIRMEHARHWVAETDLSITEIGRRCGYTNISHFTGLYKRHTGYSPLQHRNALQHSHQR